MLQGMRLAAQMNFDLPGLKSCSRSQSLLIGVQTPSLWLTTAILELLTRRIGGVADQSTER